MRTEPDAFNLRDTVRTAIHEACRREVEALAANVVRDVFHRSPELQALIREVVETELRVALRVMTGGLDSPTYPLLEETPNAASSMAGDSIHEDSCEVPKHNQSPHLAGTPNREGCP